MGLLHRMFGNEDKAHGHAQPFQASTQFVPSQGHRHQAASLSAERKDLLRVVLRETLMGNGIPLAWVGADALNTMSSGRISGVHLRLLLRHWSPRLLHHSMAFQQELQDRLLALDPMSGGWLMGISWQYALPDDTVCPPLPHPGAWLDSPAQNQSPASQTHFMPGGNADVIAGPVRIASDARADLERMLAVRDADVRRNTRPSGNTFAPTEPSPL